MIGAKGRVLLLISACGIFACGERVGELDFQRTSTLPDIDMLKGHAVFGHEVRTIRPCGDQETLWVIDSSGVLWEMHQELTPGVEPYEEVFAIITGTAGEAHADGFGADYASSFYVNQVLYAAGEGWGCDLDLSRFQFRLSGNEPFWTLVVTDSTIELNRMDSGLQTWSDPQLKPIDIGFTLHAEADGTHAIEITVWEQPCRDSMSGAYYGYSASVKLAEEELIGCAIRGNMR